MILDFWKFEVQIVLPDLEVRFNPWIHLLRVILDKERKKIMTNSH